MVAGELTTDSLRLSDFGGSSRGLLDAEVAMANAEAAVDVLLLFAFRGECVNSCRRRCIRLTASGEELSVVRQ